MKTVRQCSHTISARAQALLDADEAYLHAAEHEIISGQSALNAELEANRFPNESDLASMPAGHSFPSDTLDQIRKIPGMSRL